MFAKSVSYLIIVVLSISLVEVNSQVCVTQIRVTRRIYKTYLNYYGRVLGKWDTQDVMKETKVCCSGYSKENYYGEASEENCVPICRSRCTNGYCKYPNVCACNAGFTKRNDACEPFCCLHGSCVGNTNTCQCESGYNLVNNTCQPHCTENCENGICTAPETCECNPGYHKLMRKRRSNPFNTPSCIPICPGGCPMPSYCDAPGICKCHTGWRLSENKSDGCVPICKLPCGNGTCVLPDQCLCNPGYRNSYTFEDRQVCAPICNDCESSYCVAPNTCINELTSKSSDEESTTTSPLNTETSSSYSTDEDENESTTSTVSYSEGSSVTDIGVGDDVYTSVALESNVTDISVTSTEKTWMFIWIPIIVIVIAGLISLVLWRRTPMIIINYFKRRSYNVQGAFIDRNLNHSNRNGCDSYESLHFITDEEKVNQS